MKSSGIALCLLFTSLIAGGQNLVVSVQAESTVAGPQYGPTVMYESKNAFGIGAFFQQNALPSRETGQISSFYGSHLQVPLVRDSKILFFAVLRGGIANKQFVVIVPGVETRLNVTKRLATGLSASMRMGYPALSARLILKCF
jgi:hypothetical protein